ncbi:MAG: hypothetical protein B6U89_01740 [Desulfurococcales archaeon ex4484_58]|nr:MAG: hypothetical protein B6U89_01740 [Desulfurococcales archaeon ex4484_58]
MKAVDPVIATLILIAIAVIAGVFVLRQFLTMANISSGQRFLQVQDLVFVRTLSVDGTKMNISMTYSVKNTGDRQITLKEIRVPDANFTMTDLDILLRPGETYQGSLQIMTNADYDVTWEKGTEHTAIFVYQVAGTPNVESVSQKGTVQ